MISLLVHSVTSAPCTQVIKTGIGAELHYPLPPLSLITHSGLCAVSSAAHSFRADPSVSGLDVAGWNSWPTQFCCLSDHGGVERHMKPVLQSTEVHGSEDDLQVRLQPWTRLNQSTAVLPHHHVAVCAKTVSDVFENGAVLFNRFDDHLSVVMKHVIGVFQRTSAVSRP